MYTSSPAWSLPGRGKAKGGRLSPGPGSYNPAHNETVLSFKLGTSARETLRLKSQTPGPGNYEMRDKRVSTAIG